VSAHISRVAAFSYFIEYSIYAGKDKRKDIRDKSRKKLQKNYSLFQKVLGQGPDVYTYNHSARLYGRSNSLVSEAVYGHGHDRKNREKHVLYPAAYNSFQRTSGFSYLCFFLS